MSYPRLAARLYNTPLLIEPGKAEVIEAVFRAYAGGQQLELPAREAAAELRGPVTMERTDAGYYLTPGGVAVLPVHGTLVQRANGMDALSGLTSYAALARRFAAAQADPKVRATVLEFDTPGGEAAGVFDLGQQFAEATKPVYAHANEMAYSAGYALAASAKAGLYLPGPASVGSVGVIMMHVDQSQADAKRGLVYTPIFAGARKADFSSHAPLTEQARATAQAEVDRLYQIFVDHVASARGIDPAAVRGTEAGLLTPGQAIDLRMADGVESFSQTIQRATDEAAAASHTGFSFTQRRAGALNEKGANMAEEKKAPATTAATPEQIEAARAEGVAQANAELPAKLAAATKDGVTAERARIKSILTADAAKDRPALAQHLAFDTDMAPEAATAMLAKAGVESAAPANALADAMAKVPNPKVTPSAEASGEAPKVSLDTASIYELRRKASQPR